MRVGLIKLGHDVGDAGNIGERSRLDEAASRLRLRGKTVGSAKICLRTAGIASAQRASLNIRSQSFATVWSSVVAMCRNRLQTASGYSESYFWILPSGAPLFLPLPPVP